MYAACRAILLLGLVGSTAAASSSDSEVARTTVCSSGPALSFLCKILLLRKRLERRDTLRSLVATAPIAAPPPSSLPRQSTTFYVLGDIPYNASQAVKLKQQMLALPKNAEFVVHVGDLRRAGKDIPCTRSEYSNVAALLRLSHCPVFVILGDNDWTDCPNRAEGLKMWQDEFLGFQSKYWTHNFAVVNQPGRRDNFVFAHKGTLFVGLNIVGGEVHDATEWSTRLTQQRNWTIEQIRLYRKLGPPGNVGRVVIFGHANPNTRHDLFFQPLKVFIRDELKTPVLYINGDKHEWMYEPNFYGQNSWLRITVSGLAADPPLKVVVNANGKLVPTREAFAIDRRL
jgi:Calcineurin-like phosphoesterase